MPLFRRRQPLHRRLAEAGDLSLDPVSPPSPPGLAAEPPGWTGDARGEAGIHGVPRARRWDTVVTTDAPGLSGDAVHFVALSDRSLVVEEEEPDDTWAVAASRIALLEVRGLTADEAELVATRDGRVLRLDGQTHLGRAPVLERAGEAQGAEYVVRASRVEGDLWEVEATPL